MKVTTLCYLQKDEKILMLYRNKKEHDENEGKWIGVGGKLEPGESPDDCLRREVFEETGYTLCGYTFRGIITFISDTFEDQLMLLYTGDSFTGEMKTSCDEGELKWINRADIMDLSLWEGDRLFLPALLFEDSQIHMKLVYRSDELIESRTETAG